MQSSLLSFPLCSCSCHLSTLLDTAEVTKSWSLPVTLSPAGRAVENSSAHLRPALHTPVPQEGSAEVRLKGVRHGERGQKSEQLVTMSESWLMEESPKNPSASAVKSRPNRVRAQEANQPLGRKNGPRLSVPGSAET